MTNFLISNVRGGASARGARQSSDSFSGVARPIRRLSARIIATELLAVAGICFLTSVIYFNLALTVSPPAREYLLAAVVIAVLVVLTALGFRQYVAIQLQSRDRYMWSGLGAVTLAFSLFLSFLFVFKIAEWYSRGTFFFQFLGVSAAILVARGSMHGLVRDAIKSGRIEARKVVLIGDVQADDVILRNLRQAGIHCAGMLPFPFVHGHVAVGAGAFSSNIRTLVDKCRQYKPDDIVFLAGQTDLPRIALLADALAELPTAVHVVPTGTHELWDSASIAKLGGTPTIQILHPPLSAFDLAVKRGFDICVGALGLLLLAPLLSVVSLMIKLDSRGPVLFRQNRHGYNNEVIPVLKFRTMTVAESGETVTTFSQVKTNDVRVTPLGRILRRTNIDELPQLLNVLRGEMSVVGPRPHPIALNAMFRDRIMPFSRRHNVKPGLTGWAQAHGFRGETDTVEKMRLRVEHDLYYIENWSFTLDLRIILMTLFSKSSYQNAY